MQLAPRSTLISRHLLLVLVALALLAPSPSGQPLLAQTVPVATAAPCWPTDTPAGAIAGQPAPVFCVIVNQGADTSRQGANTWLDEFDHGLSFASFTHTPYRIFEALGVHQTRHWRHANHWMVDIAPDGPDEAATNGAIGGAMLRPDRTFRFQAGVLRVDTEYAAGLPAYGGHAWGEIIITTGDHPVYNGNPAGEEPRRDTLYGYDLFPNHWTLGCRFQADSHTTCSLMNNSTQGANDGGRAWEISFFQIVGETAMGGVSDGTFYRFCQTGDPDMECRDRFRLELTQTSLTIYANGSKYFEQTGLPPLPEELVNGNLYIYLASIVNLATADTVRFHWDHLAVNSPDAPSAAPGFQSEPLTEPFYLPFISADSRRATSSARLADWARNNLCSVEETRSSTAVMVNGQ